MAGSGLGIGVARRAVNFAGVTQSQGCDNASSAACDVIDVLVDKTVAQTEGNKAQPCEQRECVSQRIGLRFRE